MGLGYLTVKASMADYTVPIEGAVVVIQDTNGCTLYTLTTDASGKTETVELYAPDKIFDMDPNYTGAPYSTYRVVVSHPGFVTEIINGVQIFDTVEALQEVDMRPALYHGEPAHVTNITPHKQELIEPWNQQGPMPFLAGRVLHRVIIPDFITVHLGRYTDANARNIRVPFPLYIKNVASSEIYPTWPNASLEANIRAIMNFALNRVYTEWYRVRGYNFDITSSTSTDMYFVEGRDIFTNIGAIVDRVMGEYLRRPNHIEPFFTAFCDGRTVSCPGLSQWGTVTLANNGYTPIQILRYYYPNDLMIDTAPIAPITESFPGIPLSQGTQGPDVELMQKYLNRIRQNYPSIPNIANPNGIFGTDTVNAVRTFQQIFSMPQTGIIDRATWNRISYIFVAVAKLADLNSEGDRIVTGTIPPNTVISMGAKGGLVTRLQFMLNYIAQFYPEVPELAQDGTFGSGTRDAVIAFQNRFDLTPDGVVGPATWAKLHEVYNSVKSTVPAPPPTPPPTGPVYPGTPLRIGSTGESVRIMQQYLNALSSAFPAIPSLTVDGIFGPLTETAVIAFQRQFGLTTDGIIGPVTWNAIVTQYNNLQTAPPQYITYTVQSGDTLWLLAQRFGTTVDAIKSLNSLTSDVLNIGQQLRIPSGAVNPTPRFLCNSYTVQPGDTLWLLAQRFGTTVDAIISSNNLTSDILNIGQQLRIPSGAVNPTPPDSYITYTVQPGDTLWLLAQRFGTTVDAIQLLNNLTSDVLNIGQQLRIPSGAVNPTPPNSYITYTVQPGDSLWLLAQRFETTVDAIKSLNNLTSDVLNIGQQLRIPSGAVNPMPPLSYITYTVQPGDSLWLLAQRFETTVDAIKSLNNLTSDVLNIGQQLRIPSAAILPASTIVIDAGHGGHDLGAINGTRSEKDDNLNMALAVQERLQAQGQRVIMTRSTDVFIPLEERSAISNRSNADIFVSIHRNASTNSAANGVETYVQNGAAPINIRYAQNVHGEIVGAGVQSNGGVRQGNYSVLRNTHAPAMMLELGYITNAIDNELFDQNFDAYADAITRGILISLIESYPPPVPLPYFNHIVETNENLWSIAQRFGTTMEAIILLNSLTGTNVTMGQILKIPNI